MISAGKEFHVCDVTLIDERYALVLDETDELGCVVEIVIEPGTALGLNIDDKPLQALPIYQPDLYLVLGQDGEPVLLAELVLKVGPGYRDGDAVEEGDPPRDHVLSGNEPRLAVEQIRQPLVLAVIRDPRREKDRYLSRLTAWEDHLRDDGPLGNSKFFQGNRLLPLRPPTAGGWP
jgi:hypothetical protein